MSWKESKVRLLPPPQALNPQDPKQQGADRKPDIQDLCLLASQATAIRGNNPLSSSASEYATAIETGFEPETDTVVMAVAYSLADELKGLFPRIAVAWLASRHKS
jgi:hypothetical protein